MATITTKLLMLRPRNGEWYATDIIHPWVGVRRHLAKNVDRELVQHAAKLEAGEVVAHQGDEYAIRDVTVEVSQPPHAWEV